MLSSSLVILWNYAKSANIIFIYIIAQFAMSFCNKNKSRPIGRIRYIILVSKFLAVCHVITTSLFMAALVKFKGLDSIHKHPADINAHLSPAVRGATDLYCRLIFFFFFYFTTFTNAMAQVEVNNVTVSQGFACCSVWWLLMNHHSRLFKRCRNIQSGKCDVITAFMEDLGKQRRDYTQSYTV